MDNPYASPQAPLEPSGQSVVEYLWCFFYVGLHTASCLAGMAMAAASDLHPGLRVLSAACAMICGACVIGAPKPWEDK